MRLGLDNPLLCARVACLPMHGYVCSANIYIRARSFAKDPVESAWTIFVISNIGVQRAALLKVKI